MVCIREKKKHISSTKLNPKTESPPRTPRMLAQQVDLVAGDHLPPLLNQLSDTRGLVGSELVPSR